VWFLPLPSFSALSARVQLSPFPRVMHASVVFSRLDSCCLFFTFFTCLGTLVGILNFFCFVSSHTRAPFSLKVLAREEWDLRNKRESAATSRIPLSKGKEREREKIVGIILLARASVRLKLTCGDNKKRNLFSKRERKGNFR
jgi:hypothetical protein